MTQILIPSVILSSILLGTVWISWGAWRTVVVGLMLAAMLFLGAAASPIVFVQVLLTCLFLLYSLVFGKSLPARRGAALLAMLMAYAYGFAEIRSQREIVQSTREMYPLESVADRLAYETKLRMVPVSFSTGATTRDAEPRLAAAVEQSLQQAETEGSHNMRSTTLRRLHERTHGEFELLAGFGRSRMPSLRSRITHVSLPEPRTMSLSDPPPHRGCDDRPPQYKPTPAPDYTPEPNSPGDSGSSPPFYALRQTHERGAADFLNSERFGYVQDREHVAGFVAHGFDDVPRIAAASNGDRAEWKIERLELVSLLKPTGPYVYVSEKLPRADALQRADTRELDDFESRALRQLRTDDDVVIEEVDEKLRMIGALRAGTHCIQCHSVQRGELIGAFTYELERKAKPPVRQTAVIEPPQT